MGYQDGTLKQSFDADLGRQLEIRRKRAGFSQTELALEIGTHRNTLMRWEAGETGVPVWMLLRIAYVLRISHLLLLPPREAVWGKALGPVMSERDPMAGIQAERDPQIPLEGVC